MLQTVPSDLPPHVFAPLGSPRRLWAIGSAAGDAQRLAQLHEDIGSQFELGDRLIYLGNYLGAGQTEAIDEILFFRRLLLAKPGMLASDIVHLRGREEYLLSKILQLALLPELMPALDWLLAQGGDAVLAAYGLEAKDARQAAGAGRVGFTRWVAQLRAAIRRHAGHDVFFSSLRRAAYTISESPLLFVHAGLDPERPLQDQGDAFFWETRALGNMVKPYLSFTRIIRGYAPEAPETGPTDNGITISLDSACGRGGSLSALCINNIGKPLSLMQA